MTKKTKSVARQGGTGQENVSRKKGENEKLLWGGKIPRE